MKVFRNLATTACLITRILNIRKIRDTHSSFIESVFRLGRGGDVLRQDEAGGREGSDCYESRERDMHFNAGMLRY